jgi:hypothetical protein
MRLLVGGQALADVLNNEDYQGDVDYWVTEDEPAIEGRVDVHIMPKLIIESALITKAKYGILPMLKTIKLSHMGWDLFWFKHHKIILDKFKGVGVDWNLYEILVKHWEKEKGDKSFLSLKKSKDYFFTDNVTYKYDHDWLHELVAYPEKPVYNKCLVDGEEVLVDKTKFFMLSYSEQLRMFREEITVIAVERWLAVDNPHPDMTFSKAYRYALRKTCTTLTKGWATRFILENLDTLSRPDIQLIQLLMTKIPLGGIMSKKLSANEFITEVMGDVLVNPNQINNIYAMLGDLVQGDVFGEPELSEECCKVFKIVGNYYKFMINDSSYGDYSVNEIYRVTPVPKQITSFE